eukprot:1733146-Rhodomonas_salina.3
MRTRVPKKQSLPCVTSTSSSTDARRVPGYNSVLGRQGIPTHHDPGENPIERRKAKMLFLEGIRTPSRHGRK